MQSSNEAICIALAKAWWKSAVIFAHGFEEKTPLKPSVVLKIRWRFCSSDARSD